MISLTTRSTFVSFRMASASSRSGPSGCGNIYSIVRLSGSAIRCCLLLKEYYSCLSLQESGVLCPYRLPERSTVPVLPDRLLGIFLQQRNMDNKCSFLCLFVQIKSAAMFFCQQLAKGRPIPVPPPAVVRLIEDFKKFFSCPNGECPDRCRIPGSRNIPARFVMSLRSYRGHISGHCSRDC